MQTSNPPFVPGLAGVVAAQTALSRVDGQQGALTIAGFPVETLASRASFEEVVFLLLHGSLPSRGDLNELARRLREARDLPGPALALLEDAAAHRIPVMDALQMVAGTLHLAPSPGTESEALSIIARFPVIVAAYWRMLQGLPPVPPDPSLNHAANFLAMLTGAPPGEARTRALETYLNTVVDHGLNASTFTARVIVSTGADLLSAVVGALGALKGPLHGGAPGPALDMVFEIGTAERAAPFLRARLEKGERLMGFGHRVYKVRDPRAEVLSAAARDLYREDGDMAVYDLARHVETMAVALLEEYKPGRRLQTNVEFYTALLLHGLGLDTALFTPVFAVSRVAGWLAHALEQRRTGRIIRPASEYTGATGRAWIPLAARA